MYIWKIKLISTLVFWFSFSFGFSVLADNHIDSILSSSHSQALEAFDYDPDSFSKHVMKMDSINHTQTGGARLFINRIIASLIYLEDQNFERSLQICYQELYNNKNLSKTDLVMLHREIARIFTEFGGHDLAKTHLLQAYSITELPIFEHASISSELANVYWSNGQPDSSIYYLKAHFNYSKTKNTKMLSNIGTFYGAMEEVDSSYFYFDLSRNIQMPKNDEDLNFIYMGLGNAHRNMNNIDSAKYFYKKIIYKDATPINWYPYTTANVGLFEMFHENNELDSCLYYMGNFFLCPCLPSENLVRLNTIKADFYKEIGDQDNYIFHLNNAMENSETYSEELANKVHILNQLQLTSLNIIKENLDLKEETLLLSKEKNETYILMLVLLVLSFVITILFLYYWFRKRKEVFTLNRKLDLSEIDKLKLKEDQLNFELKNKNLDLTLLANNIMIKASFIEKQRERLKEFLGLPSEEVYVEIRKFLQELNSFKSMDNNLNTLHTGINEVNSEFMLKLKSEFPNLSEVEIQLCLLHLLKLSTKDIATLRGVTVKTVQTARYRIKKKMKLTEQQDFIGFLENFMLRKNKFHA